MVCDAEEILEHPSVVRERGVYVYTSEIQVVGPLYAIAWRCPKKSLRLKAISLLLSNPRREGLWDSVLGGKLAEWILLSEEEFKGEYMPENMKSVSVGVCNFEMTSRRARVRCTSHERINRETLLLW